MPGKDLLTRRSFCATAAGVAAFAQGTPAADHPVQELSFSSTKSYSDPGNAVVLDVVFDGPGGAQHKMPAFWAGANTWRVRDAPRVPGQYRYRTIANDTANSSLHGQTGSLVAAGFASSNPLYRHGPIRVVADHRHFEHADGTPFFWLADTRWMGLCQRMRWPDDFQALAADRTAKGFSVVQIIAVPFPDMPPFDERGRNEADYPGRELRAHQPRLFRPRRSPHSTPGQSRFGALHRGLLRLLSAVDGEGARSAPLAESDCAVGCIPSGVVSGRRGYDALLPLCDTKGRHCRTETGMDGSCQVRA